MATNVPEVSNPIPPTLINSIEIEGVVREITAPFSVRSRVTSILVSIEHLRHGKTGAPYHPWFWTQFYGSAAERFLRDYAIGSPLWVRGWLDTHNFDFPGREKPVRLTVVGVKQFAPKKLEGM